MARRQEEGPDPPRKSLCCALFPPPPPLLVVTARCPSSAVCPARDTAVSPSLATGVFILAPRSHDHQGDSRLALPGGWVPCLDHFGLKSP